MIVKGVERKEDKTVSINVELTKEEFEAAINKAYHKNKKSISVPGFRKGKAPRMIVEGMYGKEVFYDDAVNDLSPEAFDFAVEQESLRPVGRPSMTDMNVSDDKVLTLTFETAVYPEAELGQYRGVEAPRDNPEVTDETVDEEINRIRERNSRQISVERPAEMGDTAVIDYEGFMDGELFEGGADKGHHLKLGSGQFIPGFEEQVAGMAPGDEKDVELTFPEDYHEGLAGKDVVFKVKVNDVMTSELPELDDEFAKDVSEFDTLAEYRQSIKDEKKAELEKAAEDKYKNALVSNAAKNVIVDIPEAMISEQQANTMREFNQNLAMSGIDFNDYLKMMGMDMQAYYNRMRPSVVDRVRNDIMLEKIVEVENLDATEDEIEAEYQSMAEKYSMEVSKVKDIIPAEDIKRGLCMEKAVEIIYSTGIATEPVEEPEEDAEAENEDNAE